MLRWSQLTHSITLLRTTNRQRYRFSSTSTRHQQHHDPTRAAKELLGLQSGPPSAKELRAAYFTAAKRCHPDLQQKHQDSADGVDLVELFHQITNAYEFLQKTTTTDSSTIDNDMGITVDEEAAFRVACHEQLGLTAETVEESKRNPMFREWLQGKTDAAYCWQNFLANHGGLAPMMVRPKLQLEASVAGWTRRRKR